MISKRTESHLISFWLCSANVTLKWAFDECADWRRARMLCLPDYHPHQILLEMQLFMNRWLMAEFSGSIKRDKSDYVSVIVTIFCIDQTEHFSYSVTA